ncbi:MAG: hypothetical protein NBV57_01670 [Algoriphagus sp.]|nr:hypothetical protein [Algoriphagus sp.]
MNENGGESTILSNFDRDVINLIEEEVKHIELLRDYFEDVLAVEFTPSMVVNEVFENAALEKVIDYFDQVFEEKELREILAEIDQDLVDLLNAAGPTRFLSGLRHLDLALFQRLMEIEEVRRVFDFFRIYKSLNWPEVNRLQFRMAVIDDNQNIAGLKKWMDDRFDSEMRHYYRLNPIDLNH